MNNRYHSLDGLRAVMMLLGLVLHSAISYGRVDYGDAWPFKDAQTHPLFDLLVMFIHIFRMPIFFAMAGFFAALLYERRTPAGMARNRASRILLPFLGSWIILWPPILLGFVFAGTALMLPVTDALRFTHNLARSNPFPYENITAHLWFLYYLLLYYFVFLIVAPIVGRLPGSWRNGVLDLFEKLTSSRLRVIWLAVPTVGTLWLMPFGTVETSVSFIPDHRTFLAYLIFFTFGLLLYWKRQLLESFKRHAWSQVVLSIPLFFVTIAAVDRFSESLPQRNLGAFAVVVISGSLIVWMMLFGLTGLFLRYLDRPVPVVRYIVDASYWTYLVHLPLTIWIPGFLTAVSWPAPLKAGLVLSATTLICFVSYNYLVRNSFIGKILNGRRYPRGLPSTS